MQQRPCAEHLGVSINPLFHLSSHVKSVLRKGETPLFARFSNCGRFYQAFGLHQFSRLPWDLNEKECSEKYAEIKFLARQSTTSPSNQQIICFVRSVLLLLTWSYKWWISIHDIKIIWLDNSIDQNPIICLTRQDIIMKSLLNQPSTRSKGRLGIPLGFLG